MKRLRLFAFFQFMACMSLIRPREAMEMIRLADEANSHQMHRRAVNRIFRNTEQPQ